MVHGPMWENPCGTNFGHCGQHVQVIWASCLWGEGVANNKGADQPVLLLNLISPFVVRFFVMYHS